MCNWYMHQMCKNIGKCIPIAKTHLLSDTSNKRKKRNVDKKRRSVEVQGQISTRQINLKFCVRENKKKIDNKLLLFHSQQVFMGRCV